MCLTPNVRYLLKRGSLLVQVCADFSAHEFDRFVMRLIHALYPSQETQEQMDGIEVL